MNLQAQIKELITTTEDPDELTMKILALITSYCPREYCHLAVTYGEDDDQR